MAVLALTPSPAFAGKPSYSISSAIRRLDQGKRLKKLQYFKSDFELELTGARNRRSLRSTTQDRRTKKSGNFS